MKGLHTTAFILLVIGGLNWLVFGLIGWDIGSLFGGMDAIISRLIYILIGLAAIVELATHKNRCKECKVDAPLSSAPTPPVSPTPPMS